MKKKMRFSIATILLTTALAAVSLAWWQDRAKLVREIQRHRATHKRDVEQIQNYNTTSALDRLRLDFAKQTIRDLEAKLVAHNEPE